MVTAREPQQVAKRALILRAIAFRSSLEVTDYPRVVTISQQILPWLSEMGCADELDPIEREVLATPLGHLSESQKLDLTWAGETATFFCWTLNLVGPLEAVRPADQSKLPSVLSILKPGAKEILQTATLREYSEIQDMSRQFILIRSLLQETRVGLPASNIIRRMNLQKLNEVGLAVTEEAVNCASESVSRMTLQEKSLAAGLYFVREQAGLWLFSDRRNYFE